MLSNQSTVVIAAPPPQRGMLVRGDSVRFTNWGRRDSFASRLLSGSELYTVTTCEPYGDGHMLRLAEVPGFRFKRSLFELAA